MTTLHKAAQAALDALEYVVEQGGGPTCEHEAGVCFCKENTAINDLREALAQEPAQPAVQEPNMHTRNITKVERPSDQTLTLHFTSCAQASKFAVVLGEKP